MKTIRIIVTALILTMLLQSQFGYAEGNNHPFQTGDYFLLGKYEDEPILWRCIEDDESTNDMNKLLLYSDKILCFKAFDTSENTSDVTNSWKKSSLRGWLRSKQLLYDGYGETGFLHEKNFNAAERGAIKEVQIPTYLPRNVLQSDVRNHCFTNTYTRIEKHGNGQMPMAFVVQIGFINSGISETDPETVFVMDEEQIYNIYLLYKTAAADVQANSLVGERLDNYNYAYWIRTPYNYKEYSGRDQYNPSENMADKMHVCTISGEESDKPSEPIGSTLNQYPYKERGDRYSYANVREQQGVRPAFYLDQENTIVLSGTGSKEDPYVITGNPILQVFCKGEEMEFDQRPFGQNETAYIPVRQMMERLGAEVNWEEQGQKIKIQKDDKTVEVAVDMQEIYINGELGWLPAPVILRNDRTLVPLQVLTTGFGISAEWDSDAQKVTISDQ